MLKPRLVLLALLALLSCQLFAADKAPEAIMGPRRPGVINPQTPAYWVDDFEYAKALAQKKQKKMVLLFTGSDWCVWCKRLNKDFLQQDRFKELAKTKFIAVYLDFPAKKSMPEKLKEQNDQLREKYEILGYPAVLVLSPEGEVLDNFGYGKNFFDKLEMALAK
jgi:thioredoxin-related protein